MELTTLFLVLSIGLYVVMFWYSQMQTKARLHNRRRTDKPFVPGAPLAEVRRHPLRRSTDRGEIEKLVINQLFEDEEADRRPTTSH